MDDFSKGGVHKSDGFDGWFFKGGREDTQNRWALMGDFSQGGVCKTDYFLMGFEILFIASRNSAPGAIISANTVYFSFFLKRK